MLLIWIKSLLFNSSVVVCTETLLYIRITLYFALLHSSPPLYSSVPSNFPTIYLQVKVSDGMCLHHLQTDKSSDQRWENCYAPCPRDCVMSQWGEWSKCPNPCGGSGERTRKRRILARHGAGGRTCHEPSEERDTLSCPAIYDCDTYRYWLLYPL